MSTPHSNTRPLIFGEVLFDRFPDGSVVLGGAPFNVAWHLQSFGAHPLFISSVGNDALGQDIVTAMEGWGMDMSGVQQDSEHATGTVDVTFQDGEPRFDIVENRAYDFIDKNRLPSLRNLELVYHGTLALRSHTSAEALKHIRQTTTVPAFTDINLRSPWWHHDTVTEVINNSRWLKLNEYELSIMVSEGVDAEAKADRLLVDASLAFIVVTQGEQGAFVKTKEGECYHIVPESVGGVVDTVGAGDAFSSVVVLGIIRKWPLALVLERAQQFASAIVGVRGATVSDRKFYLTFIESWKD
ncbi:MAG: PfkB family carbohydrate kinase [Gammaproteobacteria bacterium]|nr:PfkB family carbohydrate kinase [Gammaproteobacteria bacterium]